MVLDWGRSSGLGTFFWNQLGTFCCFGDIVLGWGERIELGHGAALGTWCGVGGTLCLTGDIVPGYLGTCHCWVGDIGLG